MKCSANVPKNAKALSCTVCGLWCHQKCMVPTMGDEAFGFFVQANEQFGSTGWSCVNCNSAYKKLTGLVTELQKKVTTAEANIDKNKQAIEQQSLKVQLLESKVDVVEKECNNKELIEKAVADKSREWSREMSEREARKSHMIIHNAKEPGPEIATTNAKKDHDRDFVLELCNITETECCVDTDIKLINRTGEKPKDGKPRPILVGFRDAKIRDGILRGAYKLKNSSFDYLRVVPDLTKLQRDEEQALYKECEKRNDNMSGDDRGFQWIVVGTRGAKRLHKVRKTTKRANSMSPQNPRSSARPRQELGNVNAQQGQNGSQAH